MSEVVPRAFHHGAAPREAIVQGRLFVDPEGPEVPVVEEPEKEEKLKPKAKPTPKEEAPKKVEKKEKVEPKPTPTPEKEKPKPIPKEEKPKPAPEVQEETKEKKPPVKPKEEKSKVATIADLSQIEGIGAKTAMLLQDHGFKTAQKLAESSAEDISKVPGIGPATAEKIIKNAKALLKKAGESK